MRPWSSPHSPIHHSQPCNKPSPNGHALVEKYIGPLHKWRRRKRQQPPATRQSLWEEYRIGYEKLIRQREAER